MSGAYTGTATPNYHNQHTGLNYSIQGNTLLGSQVLDSMQARFLRTKGDLACKLMAAMQGAKIIGADLRCSSSGNSSLSAFLRVACVSDVSPNYTIALNVPKGPTGFEPIDSLQKLFNLVHSCVIPIPQLCSPPTAGIQEKTDDLQVRVYPNPFTEETRITISGTQETGWQLEIYATSGQLVCRENSQEKQEFMISKEQSPKGIYFYKLISGSGKIIQGKLIRE
jgi:hypothetical protein